MSVTASAVTQTYSSPGLLMKENFADLLNTQFEFVKAREWSIPAEGLDGIYRIETTSKDYVKHSYVTGLGLVPKNRDADDLPMGYPRQGFDNTYTPDDFRLAVRVEKRLRETDQYSVIARLIGNLVTSAKRTVEYYAALPFNTGFDTTGSWLCADQMYLFDSSRPCEEKGATAWSNLETAGALTATRLATMRLNFQKSKDELGLISPVIMKQLIVPPDLQDTAEEILKSSQKWNTSLNDANVYQNRFSLKVWNYLTNAAAWFGSAGADDPKNELYWYWRVKPETVSDVLSDNPDVWQARVRMSYITGCDRPTTFRGNAGA